MIKFITVYFLFLIMIAASELNPFKAALVLVMVSLLVSLAAFINLNKWMAWSLILFYLGGMMILFIYIVSVVVLEKLSFSFKETVSNTLILLLYTAILSHWQISEYMNMIVSLYKISAFLTPGLTMALLMGLMVVVSVTNSLTGPMKSLSNA